MSKSVLPKTDFDNDLTNENAVYCWNEESCQRYEALILNGQRLVI